MTTKDEMPAESTRWSAVSLCAAFIWAEPRSRRRLLDTLLEVHFADTASDDEPAFALKSLLEAMLATEPQAFDPDIERILSAA